MFNIFSLNVFEILLTIGNDVGNKILSNISKFVSAFLFRSSISTFVTDTIKLENTVLSKKNLICSLRERASIFNLGSNTLSVNNGYFDKPDSSFVSSFDSSSGISIISRVRTDSLDGFLFVEYLIFIS